MGDIEKIQQNLVNSCYELNKQNIIDENLLQKCQEINETQFKFVRDKEKKIFGENRYEDRINSFNKITYNINKLIDEYEENYKWVSTEEPNNNIITLAQNLIKLTDIIDDKIVQKYSNNEGSNYNALIENYFKMDNNRIKLSQAGGEYTTLEKMSQIDLDKLQNSNYYYYIFILIFLLIIIICLIVYVAKFLA
jgi:hypothetical protein